MSAANSPLLTVGELTLDDVVIEDTDVDWKQPGGGALYSAIGAMLWHRPAAICSTVGADYPEGHLERLAAAGIDTSAVQRTTECNSLGLWLLYEASGTRHQFEKSAGGTFRQLDELRPRAADLDFTPAAVHLAPQSSAGHLAALADHVPGPVPVSLDLLVESYIDTAPYLDGPIFCGLDAFLPSTAEVQALWRHDDAHKLSAELKTRGFTGVLAIKRGAGGVDVQVGDVTVHVPAAAGTVVDVTGAGDAFCGGFLAGLIATGDPVLAAAHGVVSSSFIVETRGALAALDALDRERATERLARVTATIRRAL